jgi:hypothetical protein
MSRPVGTAAARELLASGNGENHSENLSEDAKPPGAAVTQSPPRRGTGRVRHEEKITVYVSVEELLALEQARLTLRARHGMAVDRGRIVREAIAAMLADLEANADGSELVRRLSAS